MFHCTESVKETNSAFNQYYMYVGQSQMLGQRTDGNFVNALLIQGLLLKMRSRN